MGKSSFMELIISEKKKSDYLNQNVLLDSMDPLFSIFVYHWKI